jgi:choline dehydrogenase-like flavoprotein
VRFFPAAAKAGARFIEGFEVCKVDFETLDGQKRAVGVSGVWTERNSEKKKEIRVKAKKVIVCAGTLNSPLLLMRSGIKNKNVGKNFHVHPATMLGAQFDEVVNPWEGMPSTCSSRNSLCSTLSQCILSLHVCISRLHPHRGMHFSRKSRHSRSRLQD